MNDALLGRTIAQRYRLISRLGQGAVATVYLARHVLIDRLGAIKIVRPELVADPVYRERFLREARAVNRVNHPNIVEITDYGEADGLLYMVMEYVPGESLEKLLAQGPVGWRRAASIGLQMALALGRAHQMGIVHRDLKPANILVVRRRDGGDFAKLTDFGVAKLADAAPLTVRGELPAGLTAPGGVELHEADGHADLYALGLLLYEATTGALPFEADDEGPRASEADSMLVLAPDTPPFFDEVVRTLLAKDPARRPRDAFEAGDLLRRALDEAHEPIPPLAPMSSGEGESPYSIPPASGDAPAPVTRPRAGALSGVAFDQLAPLCAATLASLEPKVPRAALSDARRLCTTVQALSDMVQSDSRSVQAVEARARGAKAEHGERLDEIAREHSRTLGWAGTIAEQSYAVEMQRSSGEHPVPIVEAMVWEQAALETEEDRMRERAADLLVQMRACQAEIERLSERLEHEILVVNGCLEGRIGALRSVAYEAWQSLETVASQIGVTPDDLRASAPSRF